MTTGSWEAVGETAAGSPKGETSGSERVNTYRSDQNSTTTQSPSALAKPQTEGYEMFGLTPIGTIAQAASRKQRENV